METDPTTRIVVNDDTPEREPTLVERLAGVPEAFVTNELRAAADVAAARASFSSRVAKARRRAGGALAAAVASGDVVSALAAARDVLVADLVAEQPPPVTENDDLLDALSDARGRAF